MKVLVLGQRGMLGHVVVRHLTERGHEVSVGGRYDGNVELGDVEAVINCAGVVAGTTDLYLTNALLPLHLAARLDGRLMVHPSTDCVFDGQRGWYRADELPNATNDYGLSKRLGEGCLGFPNVVVLRTSIVGPPGEAGRGLLGWFLRQTEPVDGWTDHIWNGITTLAWARLAADALEGRLTPGLHQPATTEAISKYDLLGLFGAMFDHPLPVRPVSTLGPCDRSLQPTMLMPPLREQLAELRAWA